MFIIKKIFLPVKFFLYILLNQLVRVTTKINVSKQSSNLLILKLDAIGDYVLFRNFLELLKANKKYKNYSITLVGNSCWKDLAESLDSSYVDSFYWINVKKFNWNLIYRYKILRLLRKQQFSIVINPTYSRSFSKGDSIVQVVQSRKKIGSDGDLSNIRRWQKSISDKFYTDLISTKTEIIFEFYRYKNFFEKLLNKKISIKKPRIDVSKFNKPIVKGKYVLIFPGAGEPKRRWPPRKFSKVIKFLQNNFKGKVVLSGGKGDIDTAEKIIEGLKSQERLVNLVGKTGLIELVNLVKNAELLISNETCAVHMAVAVDTKTICISNGNHYQRFNPYPKRISRQIQYLYPENFKYHLDGRNRSKVNINNISVDKVINEIQRFYL